MNGPAAGSTPASGRVLVIEHEANAGIALVGERIAAAGLKMHTVGPVARRPIPLSPHGFDGVVVLGGSPGPTDDDQAPWLPDVRELIRACLEQQVPLLGVCLGAQLLAVVAGGTVGPLRDGAEIGLCDVQLSDAGRDDPLLRVLPDRVRAFQWHFLEIRDLPPGATSLASSDRCPNQAFRVGPAAWGLQFHLEALPSTAEDWARDDRDDLLGVGLSPSDVIEEVRLAEPALRTCWSMVSDRWLAVVSDWASRPSHPVATKRG